MDKRKIIVGIIIVTVVIVSIVSIFMYIFTPKSVIHYPQNKNTQIHNVIYQGEDVTYKIDQIALINYLADIR